jgi:hypothetical protein
MFLLTFSCPIIAWGCAAGIGFGVACDEIAYDYYGVRLVCVE